MASPIDDRWYREIFENSPVALALADERGLLVVANAAYCALVGRPLSELFGRSSRDFTHPDDLAQHAGMETLTREAAERGELLRVEKRYVHPDGTVRWGWVSCASTVGPHGERWTMAVVHDTTDRKQNEALLHAAATTDALTGLPNRRGWREELRALRQAPDSADPLTLAILDFDHFKAYNDTHGHNAGDLLIVDFARRSREVLSESDVLARWGGEEFALASPRCVGHEVAERLSHIAAVLPNGLTFSAGIATMRPGESVEDCLDRADLLLYQAKRDGRGRSYCDFEPSEERAG